MATLKSAATFKNISSGLRSAATTVRSGQGSGDSKRLAGTPSSAGAGKVAQYNRQKPLKEKARAARARKNTTSITDSGVEEG